MLSWVSVSVSCVSSIFSPLTLYSATFAFFQKDDAEIVTLSLEGLGQMIEFLASLTGCFLLLLKD